MLRLSFALAGALLISLPCSAEEGFLPLFPDRTLDGWVNVSCHESTWSFDEEGLLVCTGIPTGEIRTERMYQNFIVELEWRHLVPKGNAGVFVWADDINARGTPFIRGIEIQVLENAYGNTKSYSTHGDIFPIQGATMVPTNGRGGMRSFPTELLSKPSPEWNHYRIECQDGTVKLWVNGTKVNEGRESVPRKGYLCLESEGGVVHYRNLRIKELPDTPVAPEHVAIADRGYRCLYRGVDLAGWKQDGTAGWKPSDWFLSHPAGTESLLVTEEVFGAVGLVFDYRLIDEASGLSFFPKPGAEIAMMRHDDADRNGWNRVECTIQQGLVRYSVNGGDETEASAAPGEGPLGFVAKGSVELANLFVRELP